MEKQVFVSSTYADLKAERSAVIQTVMELDCIPAGMELFPAIDDEQWAFIKRVIDDCDYYILLLGARYGSMDPEGISYTEKEYDYAVSSGLKVLAFLHENPDEIRTSANPQESGDEYSKVLAFRERVAANRLVKFWKQPEELPGLIALSLPKTIKAYPAVGWVRADQIPSTEILQDLNQVRKENEVLRRELAEMRDRGVPDIQDLAGLDDELTLSGQFKSVANGIRYPWTAKAPISDIFAAIAPYLLQNPGDGYVKLLVKTFAIDRTGKEPFWSEIEDQDYQTVKLQLMAMGLVTVEYAQTVKGGMGLFWHMTPKGHGLMFELRAVRSQKESPE